MASDLIEVFISYAHKDEDLCNSLKKHLAGMEGEIISTWHDRAIPAGDEWEENIKQQLEQADVILLLISSDFLASKYCRQHEIPRAMERHKAKEARVVPVILRECDWRRQAFAKLQAYPRDGEPVIDWPNVDRAFTNVMDGIREVAGNLLEQQQQQQEKQKAAEAQYRRKVDESLADGEISMLERDTLDELQESLELAAEVAEVIEAEARKPHEEKLANVQKYEKSLKKVIEIEGAEFSDKTRNELKLRRRDLGLKDEEVAEVEEQLLQEWRDQEAQAEKLAAMQEDEARAEIERIEREDAERKAAEKRESEEQERAAQAAHEDRERKAREKAKKKARKKAKESAEVARHYGLLEFFFRWSISVWDRLWVYPNIPDKKLMNAVAAFWIPEGELVLALIDFTVFGSAKEGLIFAGQGVYIKGIGASEPIGVPYSAFQDCSFDVDGDEVKIDDSVSFDAGVDVQAVSALFIALSSFLAYEERVLEEHEGEIIEDPETFASHLIEEFLEDATTSEPGSAEDSEVDLVLQVLAAFAGTDTFYLIPDITEKKERNARSRCDIPGDEVVLALIDLTVFGSAKDCWAFTEAAFYYNNAGSGFSLEYAKFPHASFELYEEEVGLTAPDGAEFALSLLGSSVAPEMGFSLLEGIRAAVIAAAEAEAEQDEE